MIRWRAITRLIAVGFLCASTLHGQTPDSKLKLECQVLEVSGAYGGNLKELASIHYAIVRHKNPADRQRLSAWLKTHSGSEVSFTASDGRSHRGVLRRLKMCFGRGLLVFTDQAEIREGETLKVEI